MQNEIELISDGDGVAIVGSPTAVESFLESFRLHGSERPISKLFHISGKVASFAAQIPQIAKNSSRWVQITEESAQKIKEFGLVPTKCEGISYAMVGSAGRIDSWVQLVDKPAIFLNPAILTAFGSMMAQRRLEKSLEEIKEYLETIDQKVDKISRTQMNIQLARLDGVRTSVFEAMRLRESVGKVSEITWSKVQSSVSTIYEIEGLALRQIRDETAALEVDQNLTVLRSATTEFQKNIQMWMSVIADCAYLHDAVSLIELERVMDNNSDDLDSHRIGLRLARQERMNTISDAFQAIFGRVIEVGEHANSRVLYNPIDSPGTVESCRAITAAVGELCSTLQLEAVSREISALSWFAAARQSSVDTFEAVQHAGKEASATVRTIKGKVMEKFEGQSQRTDEPN